MKKIKFFTAVISILTFFSMNTAAADRPIVTEINAAGTNGSAINLTWKLPKNPEPKITGLLIFRSSLPIASYTDISNSQPYAVIDAKNTGWQDTVNDYNDYYYAILCKTGDVIYDIILPSINSTVNGTHLLIRQKKELKNQTASAKEKLIPEGALRETPLPYLDLTEGKSRRQVKISQKAKNTVRELAGTKQREAPVVLNPYIFEDDLIAPEGGEDYLLFQILSENFIQQKYNEAEKQLVQLLGTNRSEALTKRAVFYLGECFYFQEDYSSAVKQFVIVYNDYPATAKKWIENSLDKIDLVNTSN